MRFIGDHAKHSGNKIYLIPPVNKYICVNFPLFTRQYRIQGRVSEVNETTEGQNVIRR